MENEPTTLEEALRELRYLRAENAELKAQLTEVRAELAKVKEILGLNSQNCRLKK